MKYPGKILFLAAILISIILLKASVFLYFLNFNEFNIFSGRSDADYYHSYAIGQEDYSSSLWPDMLRGMNVLGIYSRDAVSAVLFLLSTFVIPYLCVKIVGKKNVLNKGSLIILIVISLYPTLFYYSFDIYRDVFMVFLFLSCIFFFKKFTYAKGICGWGFLLFSFFISLILCFFREYLGLSLFLMIIMFGFGDFMKKHFMKLILLYCIVLIIFSLSGLLNPIFEYRDLFKDPLYSDVNNIGIRFERNENGFEFIVKFFLSMLYQINGLFIYNKFSFFVFVFESIPAMILFTYVIKNRKYLDKFSISIFLFSIIYGTIWVIGNDNIGTAVRLRFYNYIVIFLVACILFDRKKQLSKGII